MTWDEETENFLPAQCDCGNCDECCERAVREMNRAGEVEEQQLAVELPEELQ